ncbi:MAG: phosphate ABC transporter permease PstA [Methylacidiphilales bacterium]|nr:phosphate ABC transporter permease PstA [Candidatus Methylacidiphilales bacterium]
MTDLALPRSTGLNAISDAAKARVRARQRSELRFRFYGIAAIALTTLFLIVVLGDIIVKGLPAFTQHELMLEVNVAQEDVDPQATGHPETIRAGDFHKLVRDALRRQFPEVTDRASRRLLDGLLSNGAPDVLRDRVVADPGLVGETVRVRVRLSANADLYFKGIGTEITRHIGNGVATPSGTTGEITISVGANAFAEDLGLIKKHVERQARALRREANRLRQSVKQVETQKSERDGELRLASDSSSIKALRSEIRDLESEIQSLSQKAQDLETEADQLQQRFDAPAVNEQIGPLLPSLLVAINGGLVKIKELGSSDVKGEVLLPLVSADAAESGAWQIVTYVTPESNRRVSDREVAWMERLQERGLVENAFNWSFFTSGDSREPELAGIRGSLTGTALTLFVTLILCLPIGVAAAVYLEEFAPKNLFTEIMEVNINNLAAVPSIVFGLLGLAMFLNFFGLPRSAPLVGGLVLALLVLPTIIIAARAALKAVPPSIKEAALGVGASHQQAVFHHVLPLAMPGIMTGTIIGMAHALGETAPLLMIGMVAFIVEIPGGITDAATVLPVQIYLWSDLPEIGFQAKTAAAIIVLLAFLFVMNGAAIVMRKRFERRW